MFNAISTAKVIFNARKPNQETICLTNKFIFVNILVETTYVIGSVRMG